MAFEAISEVVSSAQNSAMQKLASVFGISTSSRFIGTFNPTIVIEEIIDNAAELTEHPIEDGSVITDHVIYRPVSVSMEVYFDYESLAGASPKETYAKLIELYESGEPFHLILGKRSFDNMLFKSIKQITNADSEFVLSLQIEMQQITIVGLQEVKISTPQGQHASTQASGKKQAQGKDNKSAEAAASKNSSGLYNIFMG